MPNFKKELRSGEFVITVLDVSNHQMHDILSKWIAEKLIPGQKARSDTETRV
jgi:hypothetical protein